MEATVEYPKAVVTLTLDDIHVLDTVKKIMRQIKGVHSVRVEQMPKVKMTEKEFYDKIDRSIASIQNKPMYTMGDNESSEDFLNRITSL